MFRLIRIVAGVTGFAFACAASAAAPVWELFEVFSNGDGSIQFAVHSTNESGQQHLAGYTLLATAVDGSSAHTYVFPLDLPGDSRRRDLLIATEGFADLGVLSPDYIVPNGFFSIQGGVIWIAGHGYEYWPLPTDGVKAFWQDPDVMSWYGVAVATNFAGERFSMAASSPPPAPPPAPPQGAPANTPTPKVSVIEYYNAAFGHYFMTSIANEIVKLDRGDIPGWTRTGHTFAAFGAPVASASPVCRFLSTALAGGSSHFYSALNVECAIAQTSADWMLESAEVFNIGVPNRDGSCGGLRTPVYRLYNNGQGGAPNHRYTTDLTVRASMLLQGWVPEGTGADGVSMCSPP
jgi:hypothetical protein